MPEPARTIVYRHACDCPTASTPLQIEGEPEHRLDVDGEPFPWLITDTGATFRRLNPLTSVHVCTVTIMDIHPVTKEFIPIRMDSGWPEIGGKPFPWQIFDFIVSVNERHQFAIEITFLAEHVDTDGPIE